MDDESRTLNRNSIKNFILRIDLVRSNKNNFDTDKVVQLLSDDFDRVEKRQVKNFKVHFTQNKSELSDQDTFDYYLISESNSVNLAFSDVQNALWITSPQYRDNTTYKDIVKNIIDVIVSLNKEVESSRIGLRYINEFSCQKNTVINQIYGKRLSSVLKLMMTKNQSRIIGMEEFVNNEYKMRMQYGISNKFYPSIITTCDLLLDIDSYIDCRCNIQDWETVIADLNHAAYERFIVEINPKYLEELK